MIIVLISVVCLGIIIFAKNQDKNSQRLIGFYLSLVVLFSLIVRLIIISINGRFSIQEDLPFHLCRTFAIIVPFLMWYKSKKWLNVCYYLILAGTLQAIITPDLSQGPIHYEFLIYFIMHTVLVWIPIYNIVVHKFYPTFRNLILAVLVTNIYLGFTLIINKTIGSNYFYSMHKPPNGSLLDYFGDWPYYILVTEMIGILLFLLLYLPFYLKGKKI